MPRLIRYLLILGAVSALSGCAADDPVGLFVEPATTNAPVVTEAPAPTLVADDPAPAEVQVEVPDDAIDMTGLDEVALDIQDNAFSQRVVVVSPGTVVTWTNQGRNEHNVTPVVKDSFAKIPTASLATKGASASVTFADAGEYAYFCSLHGTRTRGQTGQIFVAG